jgi:hypothetical protein
MIKDLLISFKDNFKTKTSNPLFGTVILVWVVKNWNLLYSIFNFDEKTVLEKKREFIINHFTARPFLETLLLCILEAFIILIVSYFLINLSRLIINFFEKRVTPIVYKWTDEKSIVLKSVYDASENERKRLEKRVEEEREAKLKLQADYDKLEKRITETSTIQHSESEKLPESKSETIEKIANNDPSGILLQKLKNKDLLNEFIDTCVMINKTEFIKNDYKPKDYFIELGLITYAGSMNDLNKRYQLTMDGESVLKKYRLE